MSEQLSCSSVTAHMKIAKAFDLVPAEIWLEIYMELTPYTFHIFQNCFLTELKVLAEAER